MLCAYSIYWFIVYLPQIEVWPVYLIIILYVSQNCLPIVGVNTYPLNE